MNIFSALKVYAGKWQVSNKRAFSDEEINAVDTAKVVPSKYGLSVCFMMKGGGMTYIPLDQNSSLSEGDVINLKNAELITLHRDGDDDIYRVKA